MADNLKSRVIAACRRLLRPVARLLLKSGISWKEFAEVAKTVFVEVATTEFGIRGRPTNLSRVAILTGINRREVARQRELLDKGEIEDPVFVNVGHRVLAGWHQDVDYLDSDGSPQLLGEEGPAPSFADLCSRYAGDIPASALLKELLTTGVVQRCNDGQLRVVGRNYIPARVDSERVVLGGIELEDMGATVVHNVTAPPSAALRFERQAEHPAVAIAHLPEFRKFIEAEGQALLERVDAWLTEHQASAEEVERGTSIRLGLGMYHIQTDSQQGQKP
ncbi:MAG: DUF6502 family protein [Steroidobacteraceae bacterium]